MTSNSEGRESRQQVVLEGSVLVQRCWVMKHYSICGWKLGR